MRDFLVRASFSAVSLINDLLLNPPQADLIEWVDSNPFLINAVREKPVSLVSNVLEKDWHYVTQISESFSRNPVLFSRVLRMASKDDRIMNSLILPKQMLALSPSFTEFLSSLEKEERNIFIALHILPDLSTFFEMDEHHFGRVWKMYNTFAIATKKSTSVVKKVSLHHVEFTSRLLKLIFEFAEIDLFYANRVTRTPCFVGFMRNARLWHTLG
jgi:hypothetical protein